MRARLVGLALFTAISVLSGVVVVNTITRPPVGETRTYHAVFADVGGLLPGSDVSVAGARVGQVREVGLAAGRARVTFEVAAAQPVPRGAVLAVRYTDLLGGRHLALTRGTGGPPLPSGAVIPVERTRPPVDLTALLNGFKPLFEAIDPAEVNQLAEHVVAVFQGESATVGDLLARVVSLTSAVAERDAVIGETITHLTQVLTEVDQHREDLEVLVRGLGELTASAAEDRELIAEALDSGSDLARSLAELVDDVGPGLSRDLASARAVTSTLVDHQGELEATARELPGLLHALNRATDYGSWANVYLCNLGVQVGGLQVDLGGGPHSEVCR